MYRGWAGTRGYSRTAIDNSREKFMDRYLLVSNVALRDNYFSIEDRVRSLYVIIMDFCKKAVSCQVYHRQLNIDTFVSYCR